MQQQNVRYVQAGPPPMQQQQQQQGGVRYVQTGPPQQQFVRSAPPQNGGGNVYAMPTNDGRGYTTAAAPQQTTTIPMRTMPMQTTTTTIPTTTVVNDGPAKKVTTTTVTTKRGDRRRSEDIDGVDSPLVKVFEASEGHMMVANSILAGFLLFSFQSYQPVLNDLDARVLALKLVAFGCFISAMCFYAMYLQYGRKGYMKSWVFCAQMLSMIGLILLISSVAMVTKIQLGEEFYTAWMASVTVMLVLVILPIICDMVYCCSRLVGEALDGLDNLY